MMRRCPSTIVVSLLNACMLSRVRALASMASVFLTLFGFSCDVNVFSVSSMSR